MLRHVASWGDRNPQHAVMDAAVDPLSTRHHPGPWRRSCFATWVFAGRRGSHLDHHPGRRVSLAFSRPRTARSTPASTSRPSIRSNLSQPVEKVRQPPVDVVDVEGRDFHARTGSASVTVAFASVCWEGASGRPDPYRSSDISFSPSNPITAPAIRSIQSFDRKYPCRGCSAEKATATSAYQAVSTAKIEQTSSNPDNHVWPVGRSAAKMLAYTVSGRTGPCRFDTAARGLATASSLLLNPAPLGRSSQTHSRENDHANLHLPGPLLARSNPRDGQSTIGC
jgi:hypothetical protein